MGLTVSDIKIINNNYYIQDHIVFAGKVYLPVNRTCVEDPIRLSFCCQEFLEDDIITALLVTDEVTFIFCSYYYITARMIYDDPTGTWCAELTLYSDMAESGELPVYVIISHNTTCTITGAARFVTPKLLPKSPPPQP